MSNALTASELAAMTDLVHHEAAIEPDGYPPAPKEWPPWWPVASLGLVLALWAVTLLTTDVDRIGSLGLVSALPVTMYLALGVLALSFAVALGRRAEAPTLFAHVLVLILILHATPPLLYGNLRYAWAWKHVGIVDFILRHNEIWSKSPDLAVYHNWPGFFGGSATLTGASGLSSARGFAVWAPPVFELLNVVALVALFRPLTSDRRVVWLAIWLFIIANWVGQDYFSPQAFGFLLALLIYAIALRWFSRRGRLSLRVARFAKRPLVELEPVGSADGPDPHLKRWLFGIVLLLTAAVATSHPLTPIVLTTGLVVLVLARVVTSRLMALGVGAITVGWIVTGAREFASDNFRQFTQDSGNVSSNVGKGLPQARLSSGQSIVSMAGRGVVVVIAILALVGLIRRLRRGRLDFVALLLWVTPALILVVASYDGEAVFRVYLFALPFMALLAAFACFPDAERSRRRLVPAIAVVGLALMVGFLLANNGKDLFYRFTPSEVRAADLVYSGAPPGSLLVEGSGDYPRHLQKYEHLRYVPIAAEPVDSYERVFRHPIRVLSDWMSDADFTGHYLIITRAMKKEATELGPLPSGALDRLERQLLASPKFRTLYHDKDASVFTLTGAPGLKGGSR